MFGKLAEAWIAGLEMGTVIMFVAAVIRAIVKEVKEMREVQQAE